MGYFNGYGDDTEGAMWGDYSPASSRNYRGYSHVDASDDTSAMASILATIEDQNASLQIAAMDGNVSVNSQPVKRGRGRPAGAKNRYHMVNGVKTLKAEFVN